MSVPLPPVTASVHLQAIAYDEEGLQSPRAEFTLQGARRLQPRGRLLGLCVGISRYQDRRLSLRYAAADAVALAETLNRQGASPEGQAHLYASAGVTALTDEQATRHRVGAELDRLIAQATRADTVILFLSGHGWEGAAREFFFAPYEVDRNNPARTALPWRDVVQRLGRLSQQSKRVLVLLDACHSGSAASNEALIRGLLAADAGVMVFAASRGSEESLESPDWRHGLFTQALLEALAGKTALPGGPGVTLWDLATYVRRRVKELSEGAQNPQVPFLQDFDTDAPIAVPR
jgi:uncharacterized caspase-like protein